MIAFLLGAFLGSLIGCLFLLWWLKQNKRDSHRYRHIPLFGTIDGMLVESGVAGWPLDPFATIVLGDKEYVVSNDGYWQTLPLRDNRNFWYHLVSMPEALFDKAVNG